MCRAQEPGGVGAFHELLLNNRNLCLVSLAGLFFLLSQEPFTDPFPWPNFFKMPISLEEFHAVFQKIHVALEIFSPFFNFVEKIFLLNGRPCPYPILRKKALLCSVLLRLPTRPCHQTRTPKRVNLIDLTSPLEAREQRRPTHCVSIKS